MCSSLLQGGLDFVTIKSQVAIPGVVTIRNHWLTDGQRSPIHADCHTGSCQGKWAVDGQDGQHKRNYDRVKPIVYELEEHLAPFDQAQSNG